MNHLHMAIASNGKKWKWSCALWKCYPRICLDGLWNNTNFSWNSFRAENRKRNLSNPKKCLTFNGNTRSLSHGNETDCTEIIRHLWAQIINWWIEVGYICLDKKEISKCVSSLWSILYRLIIGLENEAAALVGLRKEETTCYFNVPPHISSWIQPTFSLPVFLLFILIQSPYPCLGLPSGHILCVFWMKICIDFSSSPHMVHVPPSRFP